MNKTIQNFTIMTIALFGFMPNAAARHEGLSQAAGSTDVFVSEAIGSAEQTPMGFLISQLSDIVNDSFAYISSTDHNEKTAGLVKSADTATEIANEFLILAGHWDSNSDAIKDSMPTIAALLATKYASNVVARAAEISAHEFFNSGSDDGSRIFDSFLDKINEINAIAGSLASDLIMNLDNVSIENFTAVYLAAQNAVGMVNELAQRYLTDNNLSSKDILVVLDGIMGYIQEEVSQAHKAPQHAIGI